MGALSNYKRFSDEFSDSAFVHFGVVRIRKRNPSSDESTDILHGEFFEVSWLSARQSEEVIRHFAGRTQPGHEVEGKGHVDILLI